MTVGRALQSLPHTACGEGDGSSRCSSSADSYEVAASGRLQRHGLWLPGSRSRCTAPAARRPARANLFPAGEDQHCQMWTGRTDHLAATPRSLGVNLQRRREVGLSSCCRFVSPRIGLLRHLITHMRICVSGGIWAVGVPATRALECLIGHIRLRRSLNIVLARAQARSRSSGSEHQVRTLACTSSSGSM